MSTWDYLDAAASSSPLPKQFPRLEALRRAGWIVLSLPFTPSNLRVGHKQSIDGGLVVPDYAVPDADAAYQALERSRILPQLDAALRGRLASQQAPTADLEAHVALPDGAVAQLAQPPPPASSLARARLAQYFKGGQAVPRAPAATAAKPIR